MCHCDTGAATFGRSGEADPRELRPLVFADGTLGFRACGPAEVVALELVFPEGTWLEDYQGRPTYVVRGMPKVELDPRPMRVMCGNKLLGQGEGEGEREKF